MEEVLHAADFLWQRLPFLRRISVKPVVIESLGEISGVTDVADKILTGLDNETSSVRGTIYSLRRSSSKDAAASDI